MGGLAYRIPTRSAMSSISRITLGFIAKNAKFEERQAVNAMYKQTLNKFYDLLNVGKLIFFDTETTGLKSDHQITQIAGALVSLPDGNILSQFNEYSKLTDATKSRIQEEDLMKLHGVDPGFGAQKALEHNRYKGGEYPTEKEMLSHFEQWVNQYPGIPLVAHNASFDMRMIGAKGIKFPGRKVLDTMMMSRMYFIPILKGLNEGFGEPEAGRAIARMTNEKGKIQSTLGAVLKGLELDIEGWHEADQDVASTAEGFKGILVGIQGVLGTLGAGEPDGILDNLLKGAIKSQIGLESWQKDMDIKNKKTEAQKQKEWEETKKKPLL